MIKQAILLMFCITAHIQAADIKGHPLMNQANRELLYQLTLRFSQAIDIKHRGKRQVICGLGQSPAYVIELLKRIDHAFNRTDREYKHIAFSGNHYPAPADYKDPKSPCPATEEVRTTGSDHFSHFCAVVDDNIRKNSAARPTDIQKIMYRSYLKTLGLSYVSSEENKVFILVDRVRFGSSMRSALDVLRESPTIQYPDVFFFYNFPHYLPDIEPNGIFMNPETHQLMFILSQADTSTTFKDRLIPEFRYANWCSVNPQNFKPSMNALAIIKALEAFLQEKQQKIQERERKLLVLPTPPKPPTMRAQPQQFPLRKAFSTMTIPRR